MIPARTLKSMRRAFSLFCLFGSIPYASAHAPGTGTASASPSQSPPKLQKLSSPKYALFYKLVVSATLFHTIFLLVRFYQAAVMMMMVSSSSSSQPPRFFLLFQHLFWVGMFLLIVSLHANLYFGRLSVMAYFNGLFAFFSSDCSMPGASPLELQCRRNQKAPCLLELLLFGFAVGGLITTMAIAQIFLLYSDSAQFLYSVLPDCWKLQFPILIKLLCVLYELLLPGLNWALLIFIALVHLVQLLCSRDYLLLLRRNAKRGRIPLQALLRHYRAIQILLRHYNQVIGFYLPAQMGVIILETLAGIITAIHMVHSRGEGASVPELVSIPVSIGLSIVFQFVYYLSGGQLAQLSGFYEGSARKGLFGGDNNKGAELVLSSMPPLYVRMGSLYKVRKVSVVKFFNGIVVATARLSVLFFRRKVVVVIQK